MVFRGNGVGASRRKQSTKGGGRYRKVSPNWLPYHIRRMSHRAWGEGNRVIFMLTKPNSSLSPTRRRMMTGVSIAIKSNMQELDICLFSNINKRKRKAQFEFN